MKFLHAFLSLVFSSLLSALLSARRKSIVIAIPLLFLLAACDYVGGTRHYAELREAPSMECVTRSLQSIPGILSLIVNDSLDQGAITITGTKAPNKVVTFSYSISNTNINSDTSEALPKALDVTIRFVFDKRDKAEYTHAYTQQNSTPAQDEVDRVLLAMDKIEKKLFDDCEIKEFNNRVDRYCSSSLTCPKRAALIAE